jgi:hypothetical protein
MERLDVELYAHGVKLFEERLALMEAAIAQAPKLTGDAPVIRPTGDGWVRGGTLDKIGASTAL